MYYFGPATTIRQNQHPLIHRAPTLDPGPCLVFLDPAKKGLRYPNLKSKTNLLLQLKLTVKSTSFVSLIGYAVAHPVLLITLIFFFTDHQLYCSRFMSSTRICPSSSLHLCCSSIIFINNSSSSIDKHQILCHHPHTVHHRSAS